MALNAQSVEDEKVASAIKTDFILSAEIMAITLAALPAGSIWKQALVLAVVAIGITVAVYGVVALIVKADDVGVALARRDGASAIGRALGRGIVRGMPVLLKMLSVVGTAAMIWVGGGIILHGLEVYGPPAIGHAVKAAAEAVAHAFPPLAAILEWAVEAAISGVIGLLVGAASIPVVGFVFAPAWKCAEASAATARMNRDAPARAGFSCAHAPCEPVHLCLCAAGGIIVSADFTADARDFVSRAAIAGETVFAARHLPLARATSLESWSDLSGAPYLRAGFFVRKGHARTVGG